MNNNGFKVCPFCKEEIRASAIKCRYCGEWLEVPPEEVALRKPEAHGDMRVTPPSLPDVTSSTTSSPDQASAKSPPLVSPPPSALQPLVGEERYMPPEMREQLVQKANAAEDSYDGDPSGLESEAKADVEETGGALKDATGPCERAEGFQGQKTERLLPTRWLSFYIYGRIPLSIAATALSGIAVFFADRDEWPAHVPELTGSVLDICLLTLLFVGLHRRRLWGWRLNWLMLVLETLLRPVEKAGDAGTYLWWLIVAAGLWFLPNAIYFKKRRYLFTSGRPETTVIYRKEEQAGALAVDFSPTPGLTDEAPPVGEGGSATKKRGNYFARHWRGDLSLKVSYWVNCVGVSMLFTTFAYVLKHAMANADLRFCAVVIVGTNFLATCMVVWQIVGTWRAAGRSKSRVWATVVYVVMVLWILTNSAIIIGTLAPQTVEFCRILGGDTSLPPYQLRILPGGTEMELRGGLRAGAAMELAKALDLAPQVKVLHINSVGGRLHEAQQMARMVQERGLTTYTSEQCLSAATLVFLAGKERIAAPGAQMGFHCGAFPGLTSLQQMEMDAQMREGMRSAGVADWFIRRAMDTPNESMWYPTFDELVEGQVVTTRSAGEEFAESQDMSAWKAEDLDRLPGEIPAFATIQELEPEIYRKMIADFKKAISTGKTRAEAIATATQSVAAALDKYLPAASDEAVLSLRDLWIELLSQYKDKDSRACVAILTGAPIRSSSAFQEWNIKAMTVIDKVMRSGALRVLVPIDKEAADEDLETVGREVADKYGTDALLLQDQAQWMDNADKVCNMALLMYRQMAMLPDARSANLLRYLLTSPDE